MAWEKKVPMVHTSFVLAACCLITPFALIGCIFLWLAVVIAQCKLLMSEWYKNLIICILIFITFFIPATLYITSNSMSFPMYWIWNNPLFSRKLYGYGLLVSLGLPALLIYLNRAVFDRKETMLIGIVFLSLIFSTLISVGYCNDFPIRSSACALFVLNVFIAKCFCTAKIKSISSILILSFTGIAIFTHCVFSFKNIKKLGIPPADNIQSFILYKDPGTLHQRKGKQNSFFFKHLAK